MNYSSDSLHTVNDDDDDADAKVSDACLLTENDGISYPLIWYFVLMLHQHLIML